MRFFNFKNVSRMFQKKKGAWDTHWGWMAHERRTQSFVPLLSGRAAAECTRGKSLDRNSKSDWFCCLLRAARQKKKGGGGAARRSTSQHNCGQLAEVSASAFLEPRQPYQA